VLFLTVATVIWLSVVLLRFYPRYAPKEEGGLGGDPSAFNAVVALLRWIGIGVGLTGLVLVWAFGPEDFFGSYRSLLGMAAIVFVGNSLMELGLATARARGQPRAYSVAAGLNALLRLPFGILIFWVSATGVAGFLCGFGLVPIIVSILLMRRDLVHPVSFRLTFEQKAFLKECLLYGMPILVTLILNFFLGNTDRFLLKYFQGDAMVGAYAAATGLLEQPMTMLFQTLMIAVFPAITALYETKGREATQDLLRELTRQFLLFCLPLCVMLSVLSRPIMFALTKKDYWDVYVVAPWLVTASFMYGLSYYATFGLHLSKKTGVLLAVTVISIAVNLGVNMVAIPRYGYIGCGIAKLTANTVLVGVVALASRRHLHWPFPWKSLLRIGFASSAAGAMVFLLQRHLTPNLLNLVILSCSFGIAYVIMSLVAREVRLNDLLGLIQSRAKPGGR